MPQIIPQLGGTDGVRQTMSLMSRLANEAALNPLIRAQAAQAISNCDRVDWRCQAISLMLWTQRKMHFVQDPANAEALHNPSMIAQAVHEGRYVYGDCDDFSAYLAALMIAIGLKPVFRAVGYDHGGLQHVYVTYKGLKLDPTRDAWTERPTLPKMETSALEVPT